MHGGLNKTGQFHKFCSAACILTQWPTNCRRRWHKGMLSRPVDTWLSPQWQLALLTATFVWELQCLWRGLQWELVVITGPLVLSEMLSNQHSHYWVTWHLLPNHPPHTHTSLQFTGVNECQSLILSVLPTEWSMAFIWLAWAQQQWDVLHRCGRRKQQGKKNIYFSRSEQNTLVA